MIIEQNNISDKHFDELAEKIMVINQRLAGLKHEARQPRLATEADVEADKKICKRTEGAAGADRAKYNKNNPSAKRSDDGLTSLTSFSKKIEPPLAPKKCIGAALVNKGAEAPKLHLPPVEVRMLPSAAGGLLPASIASTAMRTIYPRPFFFLEPR